MVASSSLQRFVRIDEAAMTGVQFSKDSNACEGETDESDRIENPYL